MADANKAPEPPETLSPATVLAALQAKGHRMGRASGRVRDHRGGVTARKVSPWHVAVFAPSAAAAKACASDLEAAGFKVQCAVPGFANGCFQVRRV